MAIRIVIAPTVDRTLVANQLVDYVGVLSKGRDHADEPVNLPTTDIPKTRDFLATYFDLRCLAEDEAGKIVVMRACSDENLAGAIVTLSNFKKGQDIVYPGAFHIGFMQKSRDAVQV